MALKSERIRDDNLFNFESPRRRILVFITQAGHISGHIMRGIAYRRPTAIEELQKELEKDNTIGRVIYIDHFIFVIYRKHYNSKVSLKEFERIISPIANEINEFPLKRTLEDMTQYKDLVDKYFPSIEYRYSSEWPYE